MIVLHTCVASLACASDREDKTSYLCYQNLLLEWRVNVPHITFFRTPTGKAPFCNFYSIVLTSNGCKKEKKKNTAHPVFCLWWENISNISYAC